MNSPAGTTTISGQVSQSLKLSFGLRQRFSLPTSASIPRQGACDAGFEGGEASSIAVANLPLFLSHCFRLSTQEQFVSSSHAARSE
jgi:hypothetical protein